MTTKAPSPIKASPPDTLESIAYASVAAIPTVEPHDRERLGYCIWLWLTRRRDPLDVAFKTAQARLLIPEEEAVQRVKEALQSHGISL
jgi:hypothetical protein